MKITGVRAHALASALETPFAPLAQRDGWLARRDAPGLGIEVDREALERFAAVPG